jgi:hypothetical protein
LFSYTLRPCPFPNIRDYVSHLYRTIGKIRRKNCEKCKWVRVRGGPLPQREARKGFYCMLS